MLHRSHHGVALEGQDLYTLPVEDRRGGNGQIYIIFAADYFGYSLVAKKTLFRTREYNIIMRLNHSNIVPLLVLMVGEVSHRKRFFYYIIISHAAQDEWYIYKLELELNALFIKLN